MKTILLSAQSRSQTGKGPNRRLRQLKKIPAILYGLGTQPVNLTLDDHTFHRAVDKIGDEMVMFEIHSDAPGVEHQLAVLREVQRDPVTDRIVHLDMMRIDMNKPIEVDVAVHGKGAPVGVKNGGILEQATRVLNLRCLPNQVPSFIEVEIQNLGVNESIHVRDIVLAEGVELLSSSDDVLFSVIPPRIEEEVAEGEETTDQPELIGKKKEEEAGEGE
ncbi:50S ribosomal protein L25 [bacterium]|nr:50S ribosomal protein L25 [bacterium]